LPGPGQAIMPRGRPLPRRPRHLNVTMLLDVVSPLGPIDSLGHPNDRNPMYSRVLLRKGCDPRGCSRVAWQRASWPSQTSALREDPPRNADAGLAVSDFYRPAHGHIWAAVLSLDARPEPVDPVTVADELRREGLLELTGDPGALMALQAGAPSIGGAGRYAGIVVEIATLRRLIDAGQRVAEVGYSLPDDVGTALGEAEARAAQPQSLSGGCVVFAVGDLGHRLGQRGPGRPDPHPLSRRGAYRARVTCLPVTGLYARSS
jgi:hypothetical protein